MNCQEVRRHWELFYDSEGDAELHFQLNAHLASCAQCAEWFDRQSRLESLLEQRLSAGEANVEIDWSRLLVRAGVTRASRSNAKLFFVSGLAAIAASLALILWHFGDPGQHSFPSLLQLSAEAHEHVSGGRVRPEFESRSDIEVDHYLLERVPFPVRCPPRKDSGFAVTGAGLYQLADQPAAYVIGTVDDRPVSIFVLPKESLQVFPQQRVVRDEPVATGREGTTEVVMSVIDRNLVLVAGDVARAKLTRVLKSYGTYPHDL